MSLSLPKLALWYLKMRTASEVRHAIVFYSGFNPDAHCLGVIQLWASKLAIFEVIFETLLKKERKKETPPSLLNYVNELLMIPNEPLVTAYDALHDNQHGRKLPSF